MLTDTKTFCFSWQSFYTVQLNARYKELTPYLLHLPSNVSAFLVFLSHTTKSILSSVQSSWFKMISMRSEKTHMHYTPSLRSFPKVAFEAVPMFIWLTMALSRPFKEDRLALPLSTPESFPPGDRWCDVLGLVPAGSVRFVPSGSSSTFQIFREASHLCGLLCPPVYLLGHFPSLRQVQGNTPTGIFVGGCRPVSASRSTFYFLLLLYLSISFSVFLFLFYFILASSLNLWGW